MALFKKKSNKEEVAKAPKETKKTPTKTVAATSTSNDVIPSNVILRIFEER
jgi:hypothetical protein